MSASSLAGRVIQLPSAVGRGSVDFNKFSKMIIDCKLHSGIDIFVACQLFEIVNVFHEPFEPTSIDPFQAVLIFVNARTDSHRFALILLSFCANLHRFFAGFRRCPSILKYFHPDSKGFSSLVTRVFVFLNDLDFH